jgi:hypothetical protein
MSENDFARNPFSTTIPLYCSHASTRPDRRNNNQMNAAFSPSQLLTFKEVLIKERLDLT